MIWMGHPVVLHLPSILFALYPVCPSLRTHLLFFGHGQECLERLHLVRLERSLLAVVDGDDRAAAVLLFDLLRRLQERK